MKNFPTSSDPYRALLVGGFAIAAALLFVTTQANAQSPDHGHAQTLSFFQAEQFEYRSGKSGGTVKWDAQGWIGTDDDKFWFKTEGERPVKGPFEQAELQLLYSWRISDFFDAQAGVRYDYKPSPQRSFGVLGIQGLAPYFFEIDGAVFLSHRGELSARFKGSYDLLITQRLILQPAAELNLALQDVKTRGVGRGLSDIELGLRLRYEIAREFAPYIGVNWDRKFGNTASFARSDGDSTSSFSLVAGIRFWF